MSPRGTVVDDLFLSTAVGTIESRIYLPRGYARTDRRYPVLYLLHGRGDSMENWLPSTRDWDGLIGSGQVPPFIAVMIDAPWSDRGSWWIDSLYAGDDRVPRGAVVETAITTEFVGHIDATFRTLADRRARVVAGYSMGGAGALRYVTAHPDVFSRAIVMGAAIYVPVPPSGSSTRSSGAFGVGEVLFDPDRYGELNYPIGFDHLDIDLPIALFIIVGDREWKHPDPADARHDLDFESAALFNAASRVPGIAAELRVLGGGHDWTFWRRALRLGLLSPITGF